MGIEKPHVLNTAGIFKCSQPWSSFWETTAAARIILSSCLHKREDLFYKHPVISWTHICGYSRSELHHWTGRSIFWPVFVSLVQQTLPGLNALSLGTVFFPLVVQLVITASSPRLSPWLRRTLGKFCSIIFSVVTHLTSNNNHGREELFSLFSGCKALKIKRCTHARISSHAEVFGFSWHYTSTVCLSAKEKTLIN